MGRPPISLQEWCNDDQKLKLDFIEKESQRSGGLIRCNGNYYIPRSVTSQEAQISAQLSNQHTILLDSKCFEKLKNRYRTVKKNQKDRDLTKKQYMLDSQTIQLIKRIQEKNTWSREEAVIEHVISLYANSYTAKKTKAQLETKPIKLKLLNDEITKNLDKIKQLSQMNQYLQQEIDQLLDLLAKAYLVSDQYKDLLENNSIDIPAPKLDEIITLAKKEKVKEELKLVFDFN
ncbi:hypothetical protein [Acinetobacter soli]|uniref:hypothetical protein n=1 Tax=Acinetobacter soli TaxID=487316 RepID=UPI003709C75E